VAKCWTSPHGQPRRPSIAAGTAALLLRLAKENPAWATAATNDELATMGITIAPSSI
jgi:hypothetical protein